MKTVIIVRLEVFTHHQALNKDIYASLEKEYEDLISDEAVKETLVVNEYEFDNKGNIQ